MIRVMIVEDEEFILQGILCIIDWNSLGMEVVQTAHNGKEAFEKFMENPVDIIVSDVEMPLMNGLELIREIRKYDKRVRCLILSGYDEFEYARSALKLDVDEYILKPIDEMLLTKALLQSSEKLEKIEWKNALNMEEKIGWLHFLEGTKVLDNQETDEFVRVLPEIDSKHMICPALIKINLQTIDDEGITPILIEIQRAEGKIRAIYLKPDVLLLLQYTDFGTSLEEAETLFIEIQNKLEWECGIFTFLAIGNFIQTYYDLPESYKLLNSMLRYRILSDYGGSISETEISKRKSNDISIDVPFLRKKILEKDKDGACRYLENVFINLIDSQPNVDSVYQNVLQVILLIQDIKKEYKIKNSKDIKGLSEMLDRIYMAEDVSAMRTILMIEVSAIIMELHIENSHYTPVVCEIMNYIQDNYKNELSLKSLSYKYHMNTSYLGQLFQKQVGCTFSQYLSNIKNEMAREMILKTNKRINDIAKEVGYTDTSYFYKKFKQCYGVSPASLREMKKY